MKKILCLLLLIVSAKLFASDPAEGYWKSFNYSETKVTGYWKVYIENNELRAICLQAMKKAPDIILTTCTRKYPKHPFENKISTMMQVEVPLIFNTKYVSEGVWKDGNIIDARTGKLYGCNITYYKADGKHYDEDCLGVKGKVGAIGVTLYWKKATIDEINTAIKEHIEKYGGEFCKQNPDKFLIHEN